MLEGVFGEVVVGVDVGVEGLQPLLSAGMILVSMDVTYLEGQGGVTCSERSLISWIMF